jgi:hypothetical protein
VFTVVFRCDDARLDEPLQSIPRILVGIPSRDLFATLNRRLQAGDQSAGVAQAHARATERCAGDGCSPENAVSMPRPESLCPLVIMAGVFCALGDRRRQMPSAAELRGRAYQSYVPLAPSRPSRRATRTGDGICVRRMGGSRPSSFRRVFRSTAPLHLDPRLAGDPK